MTILRERDTQKSKGFGFVKYNRAYHCALAFENCDRCKSLILRHNRAYPGSEFVVANTLAKWKKWSQMKLSLVKGLARK